MSDKTPKQVATDAATFLLHSYSMGDRDQRPWVAQAIVQAVTVALTTGEWANDVKYPTTDRDPIGAAIEAERVRILGDEDGDQEGILDRFKIGTMPASEERPKAIVFLHCDRACGMDGTTTVLVTARDLDGNQDGVTLAELAHQALNHETADHN
jgi:hypothetical protein